MPRTHGHLASGCRSKYFILLFISQTRLKISRNVTDNHRPIFIRKKPSPSGPESRLQREQTPHESSAK
jgi:hypothetical protein